MRKYTRIITQSSIIPHSSCTLKLWKYFFRFSTSKLGLWSNDRVKPIATRHSIIMSYCPHPFSNSFSSLLSLHMSNFQVEGIWCIIVAFELGWQQRPLSKPLLYVSHGSHARLTLKSAIHFIKVFIYFCSDLTQS